jgi:hypothetical protein
MSENIRVLILSTQPQVLDGAVQFLAKRNFDVSICDNLRQGLGMVVKKRPDWIFLSVNLSPTAEKYVDFLKQSFGSNPILFGDTLDRNTIARLSQSTSPVMTSTLSGPNMIMKIRQLLSDDKTAVKKAGFGFIHVKDTRSPRALPQIPDSIRAVDTSAVKKKADLDPLLLAAITPQQMDATIGPKILSALRQVSQISSAETMADQYRPVENVETLNVMVLVGKEVSGYLLIGCSLTSQEANNEIQKFRKNMGPLLGLGQKMEEKLFGTFSVHIEGLSQWVRERSDIVCRFPAGQGEVLTCFLPDPNPLPPFQSNKSDKLEVHLENIPTGVPLPCPIYVYLPANDKYVCMIRANAQLSISQQARLLGMGVTGLLIDKEDAAKFNLLYVGEKLFRAPGPLAA